MSSKNSSGIGTPYSFNCAKSSILLITFLVFVIGYGTSNMSYFSTDTILPSLSYPANPTKTISPTLISKSSEI